MPRNWATKREVISCIVLRPDLDKCESDLFFLHACAIMAVIETMGHKE